MFKYLFEVILTKKIKILASIKLTKIPGNIIKYSGMSIRNTQIKGNIESMIHLVKFEAWKLDKCRRCLTCRDQVQNFQVAPLSELLMWVIGLVQFHRSYDSDKWVRRNCIWIFFFFYFFRNLSWLLMGSGRQEEVFSFEIVSALFVVEWVLIQLYT